MSTSHAEDSFYTSEAALRLVDAALSELRDEGDEPLSLSPGGVGEQGSASIGLVGLSRILVRAYGEITSLLHNLQESRAMLEDAAVERLQHTHHKLQEVSNVTEIAATDILNRLEKAVGLVDVLEGADQSDRAETANALRDELFATMSAMQFQDITAQQINYASSVLTEMEQRMAQLARIFDPAAFQTEAGRIEPSAAAFDPDASTLNADVRQAVADAIVETAGRSA